MTVFVESDVMTIPESELVALSSAIELIGENAVTEYEMMIARLLADLLFRLRGIHGAH